MNQEKALHLLKSGRNVFLTGSAGAGKTYVLNAYIDYLKERKVPVAVTASTGIAATHLNGQTIHSWTGMGVKSRMTTSQIMALGDKAHLMKRLDSVKVLIIDEISMLHRDQLDLVNLILKKFKLKSDPFGGVQVVLSGDFFQLPPVTKEQQADRDKFAFMAQTWIDAQFQVCYLTEQYRQSDQTLNDILNEIRTGEVTRQSLELLQQTKENQLGDQPTELYTHNANVDTVNQKLLQELPGKSKFFRGEVKGNLKLGDMLKKSVLAPDVLELKLGAKVMFVKNDPDGFYSNGTIGEVIEFIADEEVDVPVVKLKNGERTVAYPQRWSMNNENDSAIVSFTQVPLRLGWAITVHKSQGMTLDEAKMDLSKTFERGQGYVALSRVKHLKGLKLLVINKMALEVNQLALRADQRFRELSEEVDRRFSLEELKNEFVPFMRLVGGISDPTKVKRNRKRKQEKKQKKNTYLLTEELLLQGYKLEKIAKERELKLSTVIQHVSKLKAENPELAVDHLQPATHIMSKIRDAYDDLILNHKNNDFAPDGKIRLKPLHEALDGVYDYDLLRLALIFIEDDQVLPKAD